MYVPDLARTCSTDDSFPPHCTGVTVVRRPPGATFLWTIALQWPITDENVSDLALPAPFSRDRGDILAALGGDGPAYRRSADLQEEVEVRVDVRVGAEKLPIIPKAAALVKRLSVTAAEGGGKVAALVRVELPRGAAPDMLDLIDADCDLHVVTNEELFGGAPPQGSQVDDPDTDTDPEVDEPEAQGSPLEQARARRRKAVEVEELPPEPEDESADLDEVS